MLVWNLLFGRCHYVSHQISSLLLHKPTSAVNMCILSEVTKVTKFIEGGDGHLFEDEEIQKTASGRLVKGNN